MASKGVRQDPSAFWVCLPHMFFATAMAVLWFHSNLEAPRWPGCVGRRQDTIATWHVCLMASWGSGHNVCYSHVSAPWLSVIMSLVSAWTMDFNSRTQCLWAPSFILRRRALHALLVFFLSFSLSALLPLESHTASFTCRSLKH
jgi:hypothetical protein